MWFVLNRGYWFRVDPMLHLDCEKEREVLSQIKQHLISKDHPIKYWFYGCHLYTSPSPRDPKTSRMPTSA